MNGVVRLNVVLAAAGALVLVRQRWFEPLMLLSIIGEHWGVVYNQYFHPSLSL